VIRRPNNVHLPLSPACVFLPNRSTKKIEYGPHKRKTNGTHVPCLITPCCSCVLRAATCWLGGELEAGSYLGGGLCFAHQSPLARFISHTPVARPGLRNCGGVWSVQAKLLEAARKRRRKAVKKQKVAIALLVALTSPILTRRLMKALYPYSLALVVTIERCSLLRRRTTLRARLQREL
jgi:hypothetical protein